VTVNGDRVGLVTSADRGYFVGKSIALAYLNPEAGVSGATVDVTNGSGETRTGIVNLRAAHDPDRIKARA
jgi:glycine cleavage system aminomethyltransferase T